MKSISLQFVLTVVMMLASGHSFSQLLNVNNTPVSVLSGTDIYVLGDVVTNGTTAIDNNGSLTLSGDWTNNSNNNCFGISQGSVSLNGGVQFIGGAEPTLFNNLLLTGTGDKTLNQNIFTGGGNAVPGGVLDLNNRILKLNSFKLTITNGSTAAVARTTGFIESESDPVAGYGTIEWLTGTVSNGDSYTFPFGNSVTSHYIPVTIDITSGSVAPSGKISIATYPTSTTASPNNRPLPSGLPVLTNFAGAENASNTLDRFWIIETSNFSTEPVSDITLSYRDSEWNTGTNVITENTLKAQRHDLLSWNVPPAGTINTVSNSILIPGVDSYNYIWALAGEASPLPVELLSFSAEAVNNKTVLCKWTTATELNNDFFTLEKSKDGIQFEFVNNIDGAGNSMTPLHYQYNDPTPFSGLSYYRLKQTDFDGSETFSQIVAVRIYENAGPVLVYPNPAKDKINIRLPDYTSGILELYDAIGRLVTKHPFSNSQIVSLNLSAINSGVYTLNVHTANIRSAHRIVLN